MSDKRMENRGILYVFPVVFHSAWLAKKISFSAADDLFRDSLTQSPTLRKRASRKTCLFSTKSTLRVGEIPLRGVKSGLRPGEIAAAVGGFYFTESRRLSISPKAKPLISPFAKQRISRFFPKKNFTKKIASPTGEAKFFTWWGSWAGG